MEYPEVESKIAPVSPVNQDLPPPTVVAMENHVERKPPKVLFMIPCFNEAGNIDSLLTSIRALPERYETVVVDDGSTDDTYAKALPLSAVIKLPVNIGIGGAVQTAIKYARENGYDLCVQVDGDGQHPPSEAVALVNSYIDSPANLISGSRFISDSEFRSTALRRIGIWIISRTISALFGVKVTDPTSGLRLMDIKAIRLFSGRYPHDFPEPVSLAMALEHGLTVREVPVLMRERQGGVSSIMGLKTVYYMLKVVGNIVLVRLGRHI